MSSFTDQPQRVSAFSSTAEPSLNPFAHRRFTLLWSGEAVSLFGDQFYMVALPWLVFQLTGSAVALGTLMLLAGLPRAVLMLIGGALVDRISPRGIMLASNLARMVLTALLALLLAIGQLQIWMLYVIALCFGAFDAFYHPAAMSIVPSLVPAPALQRSNAVIQGTMQLAQTLGPGMAGVLVKAAGVATGIALDSFTFAFTSVTLFLIGGPGGEGRRPIGELGANSILADIRRTIQAVAKDTVLSSLIVVTVFVNFALIGPMVVGPAVLARDRFAGGVADYGVMLSAMGVGSLLGMGLAGILKPKRMGPPILGLLASAGVALAGLGFVAELSVACILIAFIGVTCGFANVLMITWLQRRAPQEMLGGTMSLIALASAGVGPLSSALVGGIIDAHLTGVFVAGGMLLMLSAAVAATNRDLMTMERQESVG
jgi:MFS family permease